MNYFFVFLRVVFFLLIFIACENKQSNNIVATATVATKMEVSKDITVLTAAQMNTIGVKMGLIEQKQLTASLKANGVLKVPNQYKSTIHSLYEGLIKSINIIPGTKVVKGQTMATVTNPEFIKLQSDYLSIGSKIQLAELELSRQKILNEGNAGALKNWQNAETDLRNLKIVKSTLAQQLRLMGINPALLVVDKLIHEVAIKSPLSGVVSNVAVKIGSYINLSTMVAEVVDNSRLHLDLFVYEKDLEKLKNNQTIHFSITNNPGKEYDAVIHSWGYAFEDESKAVSVHADVIGNKTGLIEGMSVSAVISLNKLTASALPTESIVAEEGQDYIFVLMDANRSKEKSPEPAYSFKRIPVVKGYSDIGYTEITVLKSIPANAKIVTKGAFFVSAKMMNTEEPED